ncbi:MAG: YkvA family protein [bacterium]
MDYIKSRAGDIRREISVYRLILKDKRTPKFANILLWLAIGYLLLPFNIIPDFIPVIGYLDDIIIIPVLVILALRIIPKGVVSECSNEGSM